LSAHRQIGRPAKEIVGGIRINIALERRDPEHFPGPLAIAGGNDRRVNVNEIAFREELVNCEG
jgi:hypothetical protein